VFVDWIVGQATRMVGINLAEVFVDSKGLAAMEQ
jgi:hypothetical protein